MHQQYCLCIANKPRLSLIKADTLNFTWENYFVWRTNEDFTFPCERSKTLLCLDYAKMLWFVLRMHQDFVGIENTQIVYFALWKDKDCTLIGNAPRLYFGLKMRLFFYRKRRYLIKCALYVSDITFIGYGEEKQKSDVQIIYYGLVIHKDYFALRMHQPKIYFG